MLYLIFGDIHGHLDYYNKLNDIINSGFLNLDVLVSLGDWDSTEIVKKQIRLERELRKECKEIISVAGNHEQALLDHICFNSSTLKERNIDYLDLYFELEQNEKVKDYYRQLLGRNNKNIKSKIPYGHDTFIEKNIAKDKFKTLIVHGGLDGNCKGFPRCPDYDKPLWNRLYYFNNYDIKEIEENYSLNYEAMEKETYQIMIRGHDHYPLISSIQNKDNEISEINVIEGKVGQIYELKNNKRYIINPGALYDGYFATIDTNSNESEFPVLEYFKLE